MKILLLFSNSNIGGAERSISRMIFNNINDKNKYYLGTISGEGPWCTWVRDNGYEPIILGQDNSSFKKFLKFITFIKKEKFDVIYVFGLRISIFVRFIKLFFSFKLIHGVRWNPKDNNFLNIFFKTTEYLFSYLIDGYITNSVVAKKTLTDDCNIDNSKVINIYNGIKEYKKIDLNFNPENIILILANLTPRKGHIEFLEVIKSVIKKNRNTKFILLGRDEMNGKVQKIIIESHLTNNVHYLGFKNNVNEWLLKSKFIVLPSLWGEGCPTSILEAFSLGVPALAYDIDGNHELIENNYNGYLIEKNNKKDFVNKINYLLANKTELEKFKKNTKNNLSKKFNLDNCLLQHEIFFKKIFSYNKKNNIDILIIINSLDLGGTENHIFNVIKNINKSKIKIALYVLNSGGILENKFRDEYIEIFQTNSGTIKSFFKLMKIIKNYNPVVHCFLPKSYIIGGGLSILFNKNHLLMSRRSRNHYQKNRFFASKIEKFLHKKITLGLANSKIVYEDLVSEGIDKKRLKLIYNGVDSNDFKPDTNMRNKIRDKFNLKNEEIVILCIANFFKYKGQNDIIEAINLKKEIFLNPFKVILIGKDYGRLELLKKKVSDYDLQNNFIYLNENTDVKKLFPASDIGILASHEEGFSNFVLESMSSGLAMIASRVGGNEEAIVHGHSGLLFEPKNIEELSNNIEKLINNRKLLRKLSVNGKKSINKLFSIKKTVTSYEDLYLSMLKK